MSFIASLADVEAGETVPANGVGPGGFCGSEGDGAPLFSPDTGWTPLNGGGVALFTVVSPSVCFLRPL